MDEKIFRALTTKFNGRANSLLCKIKLSLPYNPVIDKGKTKPDFCDCTAIWDTGASSSVITEKMAKKIGLKPTGKIEVCNAGGVETRNTYLVNIYLPNKVVLSYVKIVDCKKLMGEIDFLIGMDVIGIGDFSVTNVDNKTILSYRIPSIKTIDYVESAEATERQRIAANKIVERAVARKSKLSKNFLRKKRKKERRNKKNKGLS